MHIMTKTWNFSTAVVFASTCATSALADLQPDRLSFLIGSDHINATYPYNEKNPGVFLGWDGDYFSTDVGVYKNSFGKTSVAITVSKKILERENFHLDVIGGFANYPGNGKDFMVHFGDVTPIVGLQAVYKDYYVQIFPGCPGCGEVPAVLAIGVTFDLN